MIDGNPLESPPLEIAKKGPKAILSYFKQLEKSHVKLLQCKLLLVGPGEVGKTSLMKKLKNPKFKVKPGKEPTTHGINISPWEVPVSFETHKEDIVKIYLWDFGGQDIYHATHQFFLTKRSVYIFVWEARKEEESRSFDYWLNVVKLLGENSPVIIVMNKADVRTKTIDEATLKKKFPQIQAFLKVSCVENTGLPELRELIKTTLQTMPHLQDKLPAPWLHIRNELKDMKDNYTPAERFFQICSNHNINGDNAAMIADYLHDLGDILFFRTDPLLSDTVILKPEWATQAVYALIDARSIIDAKGCFQYTDLKSYWNPKLYPTPLHPQLIRLMERFELCFNFIHSNDYFIPELLSGDPLGIDTSLYHASGSLHFLYKYEFMPEGILSRFIARLYYLIREKRFRKYGVELVFENATAFIVSEPINNLIRVHISGSNKSGLLTIIRSHFNHIHETLNMMPGKHYNEMVPCSCPDCTDSLQSLQAEEPFYFSFHKLIRFREKGDLSVRCINSNEQVQIEDLLNGFKSVERNTTLLKSLLEASKKLIGLSKSMKEDEDSRTGLLCLLLEKDGFTVKDQTRWGVSGTGKSIGRLDAMIESEDGAEAIIEAFKLSGFSAKTIESHCLKIFGYDSVGFRNNFIVVYCDCSSEAFALLWEQYRAHIQTLPYLFPQVKLEEEDSGYTDIKLVRAIHKRHGKDIGIAHLFLHIQ